MYRQATDEELVKTEDVLSSDQIDVGTPVVVIATQFIPHSEWIDEFTGSITQINPDQKCIVVEMTHGRVERIKFSQLTAADKDQRPAVSLISPEASLKYMSGPKSNFRGSRKMQAA